MAVDRGGLDYSIKVRDQFSASLSRFNKGINQASANFKRFKKVVEGGVSGRLAADLERVAGATERGLRSNRALTRSQRTLTRTEQNRVRAIRNVNAAARRREVSEQEALVITRKNIELARKLDSVTRSRVRAENRVTAALNKQAERERLLQVIRERGLESNKDLRRSLGLLTAEEKRLAAAQKARQQVVDRLRNAEDRRKDSLNAEARGRLQALERIERDQIRKQRDAILRAQGRADLIPGAQGAAARQAPQFFANLRKELLGVGGAANRVSFTFRRLFGILAAFTIARRVLQGFVTTLRTLIDASANLEVAEIGIASVLSAVANFTTSQGLITNAADRLAAAQVEARKQSELLRIDALKTTATFEELVDTFQVGLAPGLQAGLDVNQVRVFTRQISLAAQAIGLEQRQLAEEIRSILSGTISARTTRIAVALGITNEDIRNARRAGNLFEFLQERFSAFDESAEKAANTFRGLVARVRGGFRLLLAQGGIAFFEELRDTLRATLDNILQIDDATGQIKFNEDLVRVVAIIADGLAISVERIREFVGSLTQGELESVAIGLRGVFIGLTEAAIGFIEGVRDGFIILVALFRQASQFIEPIVNLFGIDTGDLRSLIRFIGTLLTLSIGVNAAFAGFRFVLRPGLVIARAMSIAFAETVTAIRNAGTAMKALRLLTLKTLIPVVAIVGSVSAILALIGSTEDVVDGIADTVVEIAGPVLKAADEAVQRITQEFEEAGTAIFGTDRRIKDLTQSLEELEEKSRQQFLRDVTIFDRGQADAFVDVAKDLIGSSRAVGQEIDGLKDTQKLLGRELDLLRLRAAETRAAIASGRGSFNEQAAELEQILAEIQARSVQISIIESLISRARRSNTQAIIAENAAQLRATALTEERTFAEDRLNNAFQTRIIAAQLAGDAAAERLLTIQQEAAQIQLAAQVRKDDLDVQYAGLGVLQSQFEIERRRLKSLEEANELTAEDEAALRTINATLATIEQRRLSILAAVQSEKELTDAQLEQASRALELAFFADLGPGNAIAAGIVQGFADAFAQATDLFSVFQGIFLQGVRGLAGTISNLVTNAFDPNSDQDFFASFGQFLQNFVQSVLTALLEIAISAIALNALSGGLLGPTVAAFAQTALGRHDGGEVPQGFNRGGRVARSHRRASRAHSRAQGFNTGGVPNEPARIRPKGLHPADTVPIWAQPGEWVIRLASVAKYGSDAISRLNQGLVDPMAFRSLAGLGGGPARRMRPSAGPGFVTGGGVPAVGSGGSPAPAAPSQPGTAVIAPTEENVRRLLTSPGGQEALIEAIGRLRYNGQLGGI